MDMEAVQAGSGREAFNTLVDVVVDRGAPSFSSLWYFPREQGTDLQRKDKTCFPQNKTSSSDEDGIWTNCWMVNNPTMCAQLNRELATVLTPSETDSFGLLTALFDAGGIGSGKGGGDAVASLFSSDDENESGEESDRKKPRVQPEFKFKKASPAAKVADDAGDSFD
jgi:hypothetical protein